MTKSQNAITSDAVLNILKNYLDPESGRDIVKTRQVKSVEVDGSTIRIELGLTSMMRPIAGIVCDEVTSLLRESLGESIRVELKIVDHQRGAYPQGEFRLKIKSIIAVGSGKGGVGKSTVASLLALSLARQGATVGLLDADIYGPSIPHLLGIVDMPEALDGRIVPIETEGLKVLSMGMLVQRHEAMMWRGPMLHGVLTQFFRDTEWGELDYLIVDMPPGTGDVPMSLVNLAPMTGAVVVCTPQPVAILDAVRAVSMFRKIELPILGVVENMSGFYCTKCGERHDIFGTGGTSDKALQLGIPLLAELPINVAMRVSGDAGSLAELLDDPDVGSHIESLSRNLVRGIAEQRRSNPPTPKLTVL